MSDGRDALNLPRILPRQFDGPTVRQIMQTIPGNGRWDADETVMRIGENPLEPAR